jgi:hypothetical protein
MKANTTAAAFQLASAKTGQKLPRVVLKSLSHRNWSIRKRPLEGPDRVGVGHVKGVIATQTEPIIADPIVQEAQ